MSHWIAYLEDDEDDNVCIYLMRDGMNHTQELFGQVPAKNRESEKLNNEDEILEKAEAEAERRNAKTGS